MSKTSSLYSSRKTFCICRENIHKCDHDTFHIYSLFIQSLKEFEKLNLKFKCSETQTSNFLVCSISTQIYAYKYIICLVKFSLAELSFLQIFFNIEKSIGSIFHIQIN